MLNRITVPGALALALLSATQSWAASDVDLDAIRQEIRDLKANYEARIKALEERLQEAEARAAQAQQPPPAVIAAFDQGPRQESGAAQDDRKAAHPQGLERSGRPVCPTRKIPAFPCHFRTLGLKARQLRSPRTPGGLLRVAQ